MKLRAKVLIALITVPVLAVLAFYRVAVTTFEKDKIAYVFESSLSSSQTKAAEVRATILQMQALAAAIANGFDGSGLSETSVALIRGYSDVGAIRITPYDRSTRETREPFVFERSAGLLREPVAPLPGEMSVRPGQAPGTAVFSASFDGEGSGALAVEVIMRDSIFERLLSNRGSTRFALLDARGNLFPPSVAGVAPWPDLKITENAPTFRGSTARQVDSRAGAPYILSSADVGVSSFSVISAVDGATATSAVRAITRRAIFFVGGLIVAIVVIGSLLSDSLTAPLRLLIGATKKIAAGDFKSRIAVRSKDELGQLSLSFNAMAGELDRLVNEALVKSRMEAELATAKAVQENLMPPENARLGPVQISGRCEPASECGGDWWHYSEDETHVHFVIGDVTGHGAASALLTSAAKSAYAVIQQTREMRPKPCFDLMTGALHQTSRGAITMTAFMGSIEKATGRMTYSNASHLPPFILNPEKRNLTRADVTTLVNEPDSALGRLSAERYRQYEVQLKPGQKIILFTDGITELENAKGTQYGERRFVTTLANAHNALQSPPQVIDSVYKSLAAWRAETPLKDDVTMIVVQYGESR